MSDARLSRIIRTRRIGPAIVHQRLHHPHMARRSRAGQFVHLLVDPEALFRRAFSVYATDPAAGTFDILYQVVGRGTRNLSQLPRGTAVDTLGPLGNRFPRPPRGRRPILVGGGVGMAPLRLLAHELIRSRARRKSNAATPDESPLMLLGARSRALAVPPYRLSRLGVHPLWATDDGSRGTPGTVVARLADLVARGKVIPARAVVYGCGPEAMMVALARVCRERAIPCFVSLERSMPCGYGVCMGCVVRSREGSGYQTYRRVCRDGPVFDAATIDF